MFKWRRGDLVGLPIFTFLDRRLRPDDNIDSGGGGGEVGDMKLFCRRFAAASQKRVRKCGKLCESMKDGKFAEIHCAKYESHIPNLSKRQCIEKRSCCGRLY